MLLTVRSALDLMFLTLSIAMFCLQITMSQMYLNIVKQKSSVSTDDLEVPVFNHIKVWAK